MIIDLIITNPRITNFYMIYFNNKNLHPKLKNN